MKRAFQGLPGIAGRPRPIVDLVVEGLELAPQACLLDTGASEIRMGTHVAELSGIELDRAPNADVVIGGLRTTGRAASTQLELRQGSRSHAWTPTIHFCDPWPWAFGLFGLAGLDPFEVIIDAYEEWLELRPLAR
jgi:hypothetical protein